MGEQIANSSESSTDITVKNVLLTVLKYITDENNIWLIFKLFEVVINGVSQGLKAKLP